MLENKPLLTALSLIWQRSRKCRNVSTQHGFSLKKAYVQYGLVVVGLIALTGCGGGGSSSTPSNNNTGTVNQTFYKGQFIDAPVSGLNWKTATRSGVTDANGYFEYENPGETITFSIGDQDIGAVGADTRIHVFDIEQSSLESAAGKGARVAQLLQTLDSDKNPDNGIQLTPEVKEKFKGATNIDFIVGSNEWDTQIDSISKAVGNPVVALDVAYAHASSNLSSDNNNCRIAAKTYSASSGIFSSESFSCEQRAKAAAFYEEVRGRLQAFESELLDDPMINNGEEIVNSNIKESTKNNFAKLYFDAANDSYKTLTSLTSDKAMTLKVFSNAASLHKSIFAIAAAQSTGTEEEQWKFTSKLFDFISSTSSCFDSDLSKCAKSLEQFLKEGNFAQKFLGKDFSADDLAKTMKLLEAWLKVEKDLRKGATTGDMAQAVKAAGNAIEALTKTVTGAYLRTDADTARRDGWTNFFEVASEGLNTVAQCGASLINPKEKAACAAAVFNRHYLKTPSSSWISRINNF